MSEISTRVAEAFARIRKERPLIHHITNLVVMNDTANVTLHIGALPVMAHSIEEVEEMVSAAGALVLNPGTLTPSWVESMLAAGRRANELKKPIVLDPVGAGATTLRTQTNRRLLEELNISVVRGNAGEICSLIGAGGKVKGVESVGSPQELAAVVRKASREWRSVVAVTGKRDLIADRERLFAVDNGHAWLTTLTGTGCMASTLVAAFAAVEDDALVAAAGALGTYGLAAELAAPHAKGPASFKAALFDQIYNLSSEQIEEGVRITEIGAKGYA